MVTNRSKMEELVDNLQALEIKVTMGVFGLMSHCLEKHDQCVVVTDLVEVAKENGGIEILVDYYSFQHLLLRNFWKSLSSCSGNPYLRLLGGEYGALDTYVSKFVNDLRRLGIELVFFVDGAKGTSTSGTEQKLETWKQRHHKDMDKLHTLLQVLEGKRQMEDVPDTTSVRPVCLEIQFLETLSTCGCQIVTLPCGEADYVLAKNLSLRPAAYAVLSNDSDFCLFENCMFIPNELFDMEQSLRLGSDQQWLPEAPERLVCGVISAKKVMKMLQMDEHSQVVDMAIVMGTDFTAPFMKSLKPKIGLHGKATIVDAASWVHQHGSLENHPVMASEMRHNRDFAAAVRHSRQFYKLMLNTDDFKKKDAFSQQIYDAILAGEYPANIMAMHNNFYWHRMLLEDVKQGAPTVEAALVPLRSFIYRMILPRNEKLVIEYGRTPYEQFSSYPVYATDARVFHIGQVDKTRIFPNLKTFHFVMTHMETNFQTNYFQKYGWRVGFDCLVLRYFLRLCSERNLHVRLPEFLAVVAMVFCRVDEPWYCGLQLKPTTRCVTVANWFQDIYRHAYSFLASLLGLKKEFPEPKFVFSGSVFTAFYMTSVHEDMLMEIGFPIPWLSRIQHDLRHILQEKKFITSNIADGIWIPD